MPILLRRSHLLLILALLAGPPALTNAPGEDLGRVKFTRREGSGVLVHAERGDVHISFPAPTIVHIRDTRAGEDGLPSPCLDVKSKAEPSFEALDPRFQVLQTDALKVEMQREPFRLTIMDRNDKLLLADDGEGISALADGKSRWQAKFEQQGPIRGFGSGEIAPGTEASIDLSRSQPDSTNGGIFVSPASFGRLSDRCAIVLRSAGSSRLTFPQAGQLEFSTNGAFEAWICLLENDAHYFGTLQYLLGPPMFVPRWLLGTGYTLESYDTMAVARSLATRMKEEGFGIDWLLFPAARPQAKGWNAPFASLTPEEEVWGRANNIFEVLEKEGARAVFEAPSRFQNEAKNLSVAMMKSNGSAASAPASELLAPFDYSSESVREALTKQLAQLRNDGFNCWLVSEDDLPVESESSRKTGYLEGAARAILHASAWYQGLIKENGADERLFVFDRQARADLNRFNHLPAPWKIDPALDTPSEAWRMACVAASNALPMWGLELPVRTEEYSSTEAQCRWLQAAVLAPFVLLRAASWDTASIPQEVADVHYEFRRLFAVRNRLRPWMYTLARSASITGAPICQSVPGSAPEKSAALSYAGDVIALVSDPQAPFSVQVTLPEGEWIDLNDASVYRGGRTVEVNIEPRKIPAFARRGALIPFWGDVEDSKSVSYFTARLYPSASGQYALYEDAGDGKGFETGQFAVTQFIWKYQQKENALDLSIVGPLGDYAPEVSPRDMLVQVHSGRVPLTLFIDDKPVKRTHFVAGASPLLEARAPLQFVSPTLSPSNTWDHDGKDFLYLWLPNRSGTTKIRIYMAQSLAIESGPAF